MNHPHQTRLVDELRDTRKYRHVCVDTLNRVAEWALARHASPKDALKAAKRKLHQVYAAYLDNASVAQLQEALEQLPSAQDERALKQACVHILQSHASTAERIPILTDVFTALFRETGVPRVVMDLACGLNPFALPWMALPPATEYYACDIDERLAQAVNVFLAHIGRPGAAFCHDILVDTPARRADVVFLLKTLPCLEQQQKGVSVDLLAGLLRTTRAVVVSFPAQSLGGRGKGMPEHYAAFMQTILPHLNCTTQRFNYPTETFFVLRATPTIPS